MFKTAGLWSSRSWKEIIKSLGGKEKEKNVRRREDLYLYWPWRTCYCCVCLSCFVFWSAQEIEIVYINNHHWLTDIINNDLTSTGKIKLLIKLFSTRVLLISEKALNNGNRSAAEALSPTQHCSGTQVSSKYFQLKNMTDCREGGWVQLGHTSLTVWSHLKPHLFCNWPCILLTLFVYFPIIEIVLKRCLLIFRRLSLSSTEPLPPLGGPRRGSIQDSLINFSKNFKLGAGAAAGVGLNKYLTRSSAQDILASHFQDKKLKVNLHE